MQRSDSVFEEIIRSCGGADDRRIGIPPSFTGRRIAVQGLGLMGSRHVEAARRAGHSVVSVIDPSENAFGLKKDETLRSVRRASLADVDPAAVDVLVIATTADLHHQLAIEAIDRGFGRIVIEKPVTQSVAQAADIFLKARDASARVVVNHGRRYCEAYNRLRQSKESLGLGEVRSVTMRFGGGALGCVGTHWIDLATTIVDSRAISVFAVETKPASNPRGSRFSDPGASAMVTFENGSVAYIDTRDDVGFLGGLSVSFSQAEVSWKDEFSAWSLRRRRASDEQEPLTRYGLPLIESSFPPSESAKDGLGSSTYSGVSALLSFAASAIDDALSDGPAISSLSASIETMKVYNGLVKSAKSGRSVMIAEQVAGDFEQNHNIP